MRARPSTSSTPSASSAPAALARLAVSAGGRAPVILHPDGSHIVQAVGSSLCIRSLTSQDCGFLSGLGDDVTCVALSPCGGFLACGQRAEPGIKAPICVWPWAAALAALAAAAAPTTASASASASAPSARLVFHRGSLQALAFNADGTLLASLGGSDDGMLAIWEVASNRALCSESAAGHAALTLAWLHTRKDGTRGAREGARAGVTHRAPPPPPSRPPSLPASLPQSSSPPASSTCAPGASTVAGGA